MESDDREPELVVALQHQHNSVALLYAERFEVISGLAGVLLDVLKSECALVLVDVNIDHSGLVGTFLSHSVHDIVSEVELILIFKVNGAEDSLLIGLALDELL